MNLLMSYEWKWPKGWRLSNDTGRPVSRLKAWVHTERSLFYWSDEYTLSIDGRDARPCRQLCWDCASLFLRWLIVCFQDKYNSTVGGASSRGKSAGNINCLCTICIANVQQENAWLWNLRSNRWSTIFAISMESIKIYEREYIFLHLSSPYPRHLHLKCVTQKMLVKTVESSVHNYAARWCIVTFTKVAARICKLALTFQIFNVSNLFSPWKFASTFSVMQSGGKCQPLVLTVSKIRFDMFILKI